MSKIVFADGTSFSCVAKSLCIINGRECVMVRVETSHSAAKAMFSGNKVYSYEWESQTQDAKGKACTETLRQELTEYSVPGDLVDHRDGTVTAYMGKPTALEKAELVLETADRLATAAKEVANGERPAETLADVAAAYDDANKKHRPPAPPGKDANAKPGKPKP